MLVLFAVGDQVKNIICLKTTICMMLLWCTINFVRDEDACTAYIIKCTKGTVVINILIQCVFDLKFQSWL